VKPSMLLPKVSVFLLEVSMLLVKVREFLKEVSMHLVKVDVLLPQPTQFCLQRPNIVEDPLVLQESMIQDMNAKVIDDE
jgi:hypothetical protein